MWLNIDGFWQKKKEKEKIAHAIPVEETPRIVLEDDPYEVLSSIFGESDQEISTTTRANRAVNISLKIMVHCIFFRLWWLWRVRLIVIFYKERTILTLSSIYVLLCHQWLVIWLISSEASKLSL